MSNVPRLALLLVILVSSILAPAGRGWATAHAQEPAPCAAAQLAPMKAFQAAPGKAAKMSNDGAMLDIDASAVAAETAISITPLCDKIMPALDAGLTNVTKGPRHAYRFLPHGTRFKNKIKITLPYDERLIPEGFTAQDIKTFYFDEQTGSWRELERVMVDTQLKMIVSLSDHFTDMINGTIAVPDHPETLSYNPNSIKDIKNADPTAGINLIEPPQPNNSGAAELSYPIELPSGRSGMKPDLKVSYSSSGGNGWMGVGWNLGLPALTIDTRWGVPRYDPANETETYQLDGAQLTPLAHRDALQPRAAEKVFHTRIEGQFRKIVRHGDNPKNYWWEVTAKNGTRTFYGGDPQTNAVDPDAVLTDGNGNIFRWAVREVRDLHGNGVRYSYARVEDYGQEGGQVKGVQLYPQRINYTQSNGNAGAYTITFFRDDELPGYTRRPDVMIDARGGFKMVTAALLKRVEVTLKNPANNQDELIRRYDFAYGEGAFKKTLLQSVTQAGENGAAFHTHQFTYHSDPQGFDTPVDWNTHGDGVSAPLLLGGDASALSGSSSLGGGGHIYLGFNPSMPKKNPGSVGAKIGFNFSSTEGMLSLADLNGDNLPDKVFVDGDTVKFRLNRSGPQGTTTFGEDTVDVSTLPEISRESSTTFSFGVEEYIVGTAMVNHAETWVDGSVYFSDVNADGLIDLVQDGRVLFNHLDANGIPTFTENSGDTPAPIGGGAVDPNGIIEDYESVFQTQVDVFPLHDTLRRWIAPYTGKIRITGDVKLSAAAPADYKTADGVRVAIQHNAGNTTAGTELWATTIAPNDLTAKTPAAVNEIDVAAGDRIYFRVQSGFDGAHDLVDWDPAIDYIVNDPNVTDVNNLKPYHYQASQDFVLAGRRGVNVQAPITGTLRLSGDLHKLGATTDHVSLVVYKNNVAVLADTLNASETGSIALSKDIDVTPADVLRLRVVVDSPIDVRQIQWDPRLIYISASDPNQKITDANGNPIFDFHPPYDIDIYPVSNLSAPQQAWTAPQDDTITVTPHFTVADDPETDETGTVIFTVKRKGQLVKKAYIGVNNGVVTSQPFELDVVAGEQLYFDFSVWDQHISTLVTGASVDIDGSTVPSALNTSSPHGLFAQPYRGWAYAGYNGNRDRAAQPIDEALLVLPAFIKQDFNPATDKEAAKQYFQNATAYLFNPFPGDNNWRGPDDKGWVSADKMSSSRLGVDFISVPRPGDFEKDAKGQPARAVSRTSRTSQTAGQIGFAILGGSLSDGGAYGEVDFMDLNGDRYPDIVGDGHVQYTSAQGGLEANNRAIAEVDEVRHNDDTAKNISISGSPAMFKGNGKGEVDAGKGAPQENNTGSQMPPLGVSGSVSGSLGSGESDVDTDLQDVNGDGLPDRIRTEDDKLLVQLNLGYGFAGEEPWGEAAINQGESTTLSLSGSLGYNDGTFEFAGGVSVSSNDSRSKQTLLDLNGDGLLDKVSPNGSSLRVQFNKGNGFLPAMDWGGALADEVMANSTTSQGGGLYFTVGIGPVCLAACYIIVNPGGNVDMGMARQEVALRDINGDGFVDHLASDDDGTIKVARSRIDRTNLLKSVSRPLGASFELDYRRDGNTYNQPQSTWVLAKVTVDDGHDGDGVDTQVKTFQYENGRYNRFEREFYGYAKVTEEHRDASKGEELYRSTVREYLNDSYYSKGLLKRESTQDAAGNRFNETENSYMLRDVATNTEPVDGQSATATIFPQLARSDTRIYEGQANPGQSTFMAQQFDALGNVTGYFEAGDVGAEDDVQAAIEYASCPATYVMGAPTKIVVAGNGAVMRHREAAIDCATGEMRQVRQVLANGNAAVTDMEYFANGNLKQVTGPANLHGQRFQLGYAYDPALATYITQVTDSFGYTSSSTYNLRYGTPTSTVDTNGHQSSYTYDAFGRVETITGPYQQGGATPTIRFAYHPEAAVPWALTQHLDSFRSPTDTIDTVVFVDGLKRTLQTKKDGTIHVAPGSPPQDVMIVSGRVNFDFVGRMVQQFYPTTEALGTPGVFNAAFDSVAPTAMEYDVLNRTTKTTGADGSPTSMVFGFGPDRDGVTRREVITTDANGKQKKTYQDVRELALGTLEFNTLPDGTTQQIWTSYRYDGLKQLAGVRDDKNNVTAFAYDTLGRRTIIDNPDTGKTEMVYDLASNVIAKISANLRAEGKEIGYDYDFNRLKSVAYPNFPGNNIAYTYGEPGAAFNRAGRVSHVTDQSGTEERFYGKLGEIVKEIKTIASDTQGNSPNAPEVYTTQYAYDTFGRLQGMVYPDGEVLTYRYDSGGLVREAVGDKSGYHYDYVKRMEYDKFGAHAFMQAGNNVRTSYSYDATTRRLQTLRSGSGDGNLFQNLQYGYDNVGNILSLNNDVAVPPPSQFGGPSAQQFTYDDLYRLTHAQGSYTFMPDKQRRYSMDLQYDTIHNVLAKQQSDEIVQPSGTAIPQHKTSYAFSYGYAGPHPHAATHIGDRTYGYDANGNQIGWDHDQNGRRRTIVWDEENRMQSLFDNGHEKSYKYNYAGERVIKRGPQGETAYVNQFFTMRNREVGTKHVYAGTMRMVSKLMKQDKPGANPQGQTPMEKDQYFYHGNHLRTSNYVTDANGKLYQHLEYFPFGETWVEESSNTQRTPYLFTAKELDEETGLYYNEARYYDPRINTFNSTDPLLMSDPQKGVASSPLLNVYSYANANPLRFSDPTGFAPEDSALYQFMDYVAAPVIRSFTNGVTAGGLGTLLGSIFGGPMVGFAIGAIVGGITGLIHGGAMAEAGTYDWTSAESWGTFITDNTWSLPNSLVASVFATIGVATGRTIDKGLSKGTNQLVFQERLVDPYATTLGNVTFGRDVPIHERLHATQARAFGPYYYPLFGLSYLAVGFYMLFAGDHSAFSEKWMKCDVYPNTPFEAWAYHVQGHPGC